MKAIQADDVFKKRLLELFSRAKRDDMEMKQIEVLGERHSEADEAFHRHKKFCAVCVETQVVSRYVAAD